MRRVWPSIAAADLVIAPPILGAHAKPHLHHEEISRLHLASIVQSQFCWGSPRPAKRARRALGTILPPLYSLYGVPLESSRLSSLGPGPAVGPKRPDGVLRARSLARAQQQQCAQQRQAARPSLNHHDDTVIQDQDLHAFVCGKLNWEMNRRGAEEKSGNCQKRRFFCSNDRTDSLYQVF
jgi:hypothetical protein